MRIESSYPAPIQGVSTLAPRNRVRGQAGKQINFRSDPVNKLTRRPPMQWGSFLLTLNGGLASDDLLYHEYESNNNVFRVILDKTIAYMWVFINDVLEYSEQLSAGWVSYVGDNMVAQTIEDETYFVNTDQVVRMKDTLDDDRVIGAFIVERVSHINVTTALNYGETVQVNVTTSDSVRHTVSYTVPDLGATNPDYDTADKARATKQVALELAARINGGGVHDVDIPNPDYNPTADICCNEFNYTLEGDGHYSQLPNPNYNPTDTSCQPYVTTYPGITGVTAVALGSSVAVWEDGRADWLDIEIETGQGERSCVAVNRKVETTNGLPLYAVVGTRITVQPDPTTDKGSYYLQAERTSGLVSGEDLEEVVWSETRSPTQPNQVDFDTVPRRLRVRLSTIDIAPGWVIQTDLPSVSLSDRLKGDDTSSPLPHFIDDRITNIGYFQKRLLLLSGRTISMSETDDVQNFWRQSAVQLLVTDPVEVASSAAGGDILKHTVLHNKDLLITAADGQYKIDGNTAVTPQTVALARTTSYKSQTNVVPVEMGNAVYFPIDYGTSTGIQMYTGQKDTNQDAAHQLTQHIVGYLPGKAKLLAANSNIGMIAVVTTGDTDNIIYVYDQTLDGAGRSTQKAWSQWVLPTNTEVLEITFRDDRLELLVREGDNLIVKVIDMYSRTATGVAEVFLDDLVKLPTDGLTATLDANYDTTDMIVVQGDGTDYELSLVLDFTVDATTITFSEDIGAGSIYIGKLFESRYQPTRPFKYDDNGIAVTTDKLRISKYILNLVDTNEVNMHIISEYYDTDDQTFNSRYVGGINNLVGKIPFHTGDLKFSFAQEADLALAEFYCNNHLGCTIAGLSWEGQYFKSKGRM